MNPEEFRAVGHRLIDWIADYRAGTAGRPVMSTVEPGSVRARLPKAPPESPESMDAVLRDVDQILMPGLSHCQHPRFFGYFPSNGDLSSVLGDYLSTGLGVLGLSWQSSPALTEVEEVTTDWLRQMVGLSEQWSGVIQDTASSSTLIALICARERASSYSMVRGGLQTVEAPLVVYVSAHSHSSVKAALLAGFGREHVRVVPTDEAYAMRPEALAEAMAKDLAAGRRPCAVVATTGTTTTRCRSDRCDRRRRSGLRGLAPCRRGPGRVRHDSSRVPTALAGDRGRRLGGAQSSQVAGGCLRLLGLLRP